MNARILFVDDEINLLKGLERTLRTEGREWDLHFTTNPTEAVDRCSQELFATVVVDMRMPGMDGLACLERIRSVSPNTVRLMLTGNTDAETAVAAVNRGEVFRFLVKPVDRDVLTRALREAVRQYELGAAERQLLEQTLFGSVKALVDVLSIVSPVAFGRAQRIARYVCHIVERLKPADAWQIEIAGMLSQLGCVTLPSELITALDSGLPLTPEDREQFESHPEAARELLASIPRLEVVADMVGRHLEPQSSSDIYLPSATGTIEPAALGAQILRVATEFDRLTRRRLNIDAVIAKLRQTLWRCDPSLIDALDGQVLGEIEQVDVRSQLISELRPGATFAKDLRTDDGLLVVRRGHEVTPLLLRRLRGLVSSRRLSSTMKVEVIVAQPSGTRAPARSSVGLLGSGRSHAPGLSNVGDLLARAGVTAPNDTSDRQAPDEAQPVAASTPPA